MASLENKKCERCGVAIPDDYGNPLCDADYAIVVEENRLRQVEAKRQREEEAKKSPDSAVHPSRIKEAEPVSDTESTPNPSPGTLQEATAPICDHSTCGISDPNYKENPEADDKDQVLANLAQFIYTSVKDPKRGKLLWYPQRNMYTFLKNYFMKRAMSHPQYPKYLWKPKVVDVGCGSGVGANIMSQEADFVWGIDKNPLSIQFAKEAFTREKNGEYYSGQLTYDVIDMLNDTRLFMTFDIVVAIEIIEHVWDVNGFINGLKRFTKRNKSGNPHMEMPTEFFLSTPNRNNHKIRKDRPENLYHVREWTAQEYKALLSRHFETVELMNDKGEPVPDDTDAQVVFAKCTLPK